MEGWSLRFLKQARLTQKLSGYDALKMEVHVRNCLCYRHKQIKSEDPSANVLTILDSELSVETNYMICYVHEKS